MNCIEVHVLIEDALDKSLPGWRKRTFDLHLSRCDACRAFLAAERDEHRRWFQAMNEPEARRRLPAGFAEGFLADMAQCHTYPQRRWSFAVAFRRIAAMLAAMLLFAGLSYAAVSGLRRVEQANQDTESANQGAESEAASGGRGGFDASDSVNGGGSGSFALPISISYQPKGVAMTRKKAAVAALTAAMAATAPLAAANGDDYQFIDPNTWPVANYAHSDRSTAIALETGAIRVVGGVGDLETRSRSRDRSTAIALNAMKFQTFIISFK